MKRGDVISYLDMCKQEKTSLQRGMNFELGKNYSVFLMSVRTGAPYADRIEEGGQVLIYEGHDSPKARGGPDPKTLDQPMIGPNGRLTQNGLFFKAAQEYRKGNREPGLVRVYEKIREGIWVYGGFFRLVDAYVENDGKRNVFKYHLEMIETDEDIDSHRNISPELDHNRLIPTSVKLEVWKRDKGKCVQCGSRKNLHFDHIIPYSKGGSSLVAENIQLLCAKHNLEKKDRIT